MEDYYERKKKIYNINVVRHIVFHLYGEFFRGD